MFTRCAVAQDKSKISNVMRLKGQKSIMITMAEKYNDNYGSYTVNSRLCVRSYLV